MNPLNQFLMTAFANSYNSKVEMGLGPTNLISMFSKQIQKINHQLLQFLSKIYR